MDSRLRNRRPRLPKSRPSTDDNCVEPELQPDASDEEIQAEVARAVSLISRRRVLEELEDRIGSLLAAHVTSMEWDYRQRDADEIRRFYLGSDTDEWELTVPVGASDDDIRRAITAVLEQ